MQCDKHMYVYVYVYMYMYVYMSRTKDYVVYCTVLNCNVL
jgi:hypothetical protein